MRGRFLISCLRPNRRSVGREDRWNIRYSDRSSSLNTASLRCLRLPFSLTLTFVNARSMTRCGIPWSTTIGPSPLYFKPKKEQRLGKRCSPWLKSQPRNTWNRDDQFRLPGYLLCASICSTSESSPEQTAGDKGSAKAETIDSRCKSAIVRNTLWEGS